MHNKKVLIDAIRNLSNPRKTNKNKNYFDISNSQDSDFISAKDGVDTPIYKKVSVKPSPIAGRGLFAEQSIRAGEPIGVSHIRKKFMRDGEEYQAPFPSTTLGYYNHSKEPNVYEVDKGGHIVMVASRDINPGDEITANYDQNEIEDLEGSSDFKRGGSTRKAKIPNRKSPKSYSRSLEATNRLFAQNPLFKKPESRKNKIFDPNAMYYDEGGLVQYAPGGASADPPDWLTKRGASAYFNPMYNNSFTGGTSRYDTYGKGFPVYKTQPSAVVGIKGSLSKNRFADREAGRGWAYDAYVGMPYKKNNYIPSAGIKFDFENAPQDKNFRPHADIAADYNPSDGFNLTATGGARFPITPYGNKKLRPGAGIGHADIYGGGRVGTWLGVKKDDDKGTPSAGVIYGARVHGEYMPKWLNKLSRGSYFYGNAGAQFDPVKGKGSQNATAQGVIGGTDPITGETYNGTMQERDPGTKWGATFNLEAGIAKKIDNIKFQKNKRSKKIQEIEDEEIEYQRMNPPVKNNVKNTTFGYNQNGGEKDAMNGMMKARLAYANEFGNPAAKRMINIPDNPYQFENGDIGTHYMSSMDNYAVPQIQDENGQLMLGDYGPDSREAMRFDSDEDANYFAEHYKDVSPGFIELKLSPKEIEEYAKGGYIVEDYDPSIPELNTYAGGGMVEATVDENGEPRCPDGYEYNPDTGYCEKFGDKCPEGYEKDPETGRCRSISYKAKPGVLDENKKVIDRSKLEKEYVEWPEDLNLTRTSFDNLYKDPYIEEAGIYNVYSDNNDYLTSVPFYPDLNYKVEVDSNKPEGFDKSTNTYYVKSKDTHQYEKYKQWQILKQEEKQNLEKILKAGLKTSIGETTLYNPNTEYKISSASGNLEDEIDNELTRNLKKERDAFIKLYEDPEYIPEAVKNQSYDDYQKKRKQGNISAKKCPECALYHGSTYDISDDYVRENMNLSRVTKDYSDVIFKKDEDGYEDAQNIDWEKEYSFTDPDLNRAIPKFDDLELELEKPRLEDYDFPKGEYYPDKKKYLDWQLNQRYDTQPLVKVREKNIIRKENPLLRFVTGYDKAKKNARLYKEHKEWGDRFKKELGKLDSNPEDIKFPSFRGIPLASWEDLRNRRQYKKDYKDYVKNELPLLIERNKQAKADYENELLELNLQRQAEEDKRNAVNADPNTIIKWKYGGMLDTYAPGGWPPKGLRKSIKTIEPKSNKITIGNAKDLATNSSAAQAINAVKDRTLQLWNTSEGQKRLQNLINTTPSLQANLFFDSKDMVSDLANTRNINQEIIDYEALMDNIINEQNQVDSYYDQNLMDKNDYFNTTVDLDTKLKKTEEEYAKLLEHAKTKGGAFYDRNENAFVINPQYFNNAALPKVGMHEVIHLPGLKRGVGRTSIDEKLGGLDLKDQLDFDFSNASNNNSFYKHLNRNGNYLGGAKSYYNLNGGFERSPFLAELREDMLQNNIIKHPYQKVNSKMIKDYYRDYLKKEDKYPLRIFDIMTNKPKNFSLLSNTMNELPSFAPYVVGAGAATLLDNPFDAESNSEDGKYAEGGEPCPDGYIRNNSTGECVLEIAPEQTPAEEWYKNWYANRVIQDEEGQKLLNEARPKLLKRTENFPEVDYDAKGLGDASGMYNPMTGKISLNSSQMTSPFIRDEVLFHEKGHYITSPSMLDPEMDTYKKMKNHPVHKLREYETGLVNQALVPKNKVSKEEGKFYNYISGNYGEEMSKRIMELRRLAGFKPDQEITDDDLKNFYQKAKTKGWTDRNSDAFVPALIDFQRFINSPQDLKMLLNKMAKNESRGIDEYAPQQAQYGGPLPKAKMGWPPKGLKRTSGSYKAPNINFNKTVPKYTPNPIKKTLRDINIESLGTANAVAKALLPTKVNPMQVLTLGHPIEGVGPFTGSPLNSIPFYGTKLPEDPKDPVAGVAFRKFGDTLDWVKNTGELNPAHGSALRFGKNQISKEGNWSEMGWANEKYPGVFAAGFDSHVPGSNLQINRMDKRNGVVVTEGDNPAISIMDPGVRLHRRLPFSNRYLDINMDKLRNDQFDWRTMGGNAQSLIERYGYTAGYAALLSALGLAAPQDKVDQYINEPIIRSYEEYIEPLINPKEEDGGEVDYELGQEINKATMEKLKKLGYTFQKIK